MKKTLFALGAFTILSTTITPSPIGYAQTEGIEQTEKELTAVERQIQRINQAVVDNERSILETEKNIQISEQQLKALQKGTKDIQKRMDGRSLIIENRLRAMQVEGNDFSYLDVILSAKNFGDLVSRIGAVTTLMQADQSLLDEQKKDATEILKKEQTIKNELDALEEKKADLLGMQTQIEEQKAKSLNTKEVLEKQQKEQQDLLAQVVTTTTKQTATSMNQSTPAKKQVDATAKTVATTALSTNQVSTGNVQTVVAAGNKYIGNSVYVFGGGRSASDIANGRFDCSAFVSWAFQQAGVSLPAHTGGLVNVGNPVAVSDMKPGDLVFFDTYKKDGHVGIYIGDGKYIGSQSSTGVAIADMSSGYWKEKFNGRVNRVF